MKSLLTKQALNLDTITEVNKPITVENIEATEGIKTSLNLGYVIIYTADVVGSVEFYEKAFNLNRCFVHDSKQYAEMETGQTKLAFVSDELISTSLPIPYRKNNKSEPPAGIEVTLVTRDIENAYTNAVKNGATPVKEPVEKPWGQKVGYVRDNNGVVIELATPLDGSLNFGYVIIYTANVTDSIQFYEKAFNMKLGFIHESGQYAQMETGQTKLAFVSDELMSSNLPISYRKNTRSEAPSGVEVTLVAKDIENAYAHAVKNGATAVKAPEEKPWGQKVGYVRDNNGVVIELATPIGQ